MLQENVVTSEVTLDGYLALIDSINQVRNQVLKDSFTESANSIAAQMGYTGYTSYIPSASTESYSDETSTGDGTGTDMSSASYY